MTLSAEFSTGNERIWHDGSGGDNCRREKLQSNRHHQQNNTQYSTDLFTEAQLQSFNLVFDH